MPLGWASLVGAGLGAGASVYASNKQSGAARDAAKLNQNQFNTNLSQQQPFMQSGYGSLGRLNTLMGLGGAPRPDTPQFMQGQNNLQPGMMPNMQPQGMQSQGMSGQLPLRAMLQLRAQHGDTQAGHMLATLSQLYPQGPNPQTPNMQMPRYRFNDPITPDNTPQMVS